MCTVVLLRRPGHPWPVLLAGNRDELASRPWGPPARHWPDRPEVIAGLDVLAAGSWLGVNDHGVLAVVLNRRGTLGPAAGKRSRGELVLDALDFEDARSAAEALAALDPDAYRPFNLIVADAREAFWLRHADGVTPRAAGLPGGQRPALAPARPRSVAGDRRGPGLERHVIPSGLSMITAQDLNDPGSRRIEAFRPQFLEAQTPDPEAGDWSAWTGLLADRRSPDDDPKNAMSIVTNGDYGTVCASLIALPAEGRPRLWFAAGRPDEAAFEPVDLG